MIDVLVAFTLAAGLLTITPGLDTALVLRTAAVERPRRAMLAGAGICLGCLAWGMATAVGLGALITLSRLAYSALRLAGACYLIVLGVQMLRRTAPHIAVAADPPERAARWFTRGLLTNLLNPKVGVFYVTFLPQFVPAGVSVTGFTMLLAGIHATEGILWFALLTLASRPLGTWLDRPRVAWTIDRATGVMLVGFGVGLLLRRRA